MAEFNMTKERYTIGRLPDNDVRIDNPAVSGHHSLIINILNDSFLEDLSSTNGTYVNGKLIKKHALQHGDVVTIGHHQLRYVETVAEEEEQDDEFARTMIIDSSQEAVQEAAMKSLDLAGLTGEDIDLFIPHQANMRIIEATIRRAKIPMEKTFINIDKIANISAATIPIALDQARKEGRLKAGDNALLAAFGAGFTWGGAVIKF